jgi:hypothetical protein
MSKIIIDTRDIECTLAQELRTELSRYPDWDRSGSDEETQIANRISEAVIVCGDELTQLEIGAFERIQAVLNRWGIIIDLSLRGDSRRLDLIRQLVEAAFNSSPVSDSNGDSVGVSTPK